MGVSAAQLGQAKRLFQRSGVQRPRENLDGVGPLKMDVDTGMPALEAGDPDADRRTVRGRLFGHRQAQVSVSSPRAADRQHPLFLGVEVQQKPALQHVVGQTGRAGESGFFVDGEQELERTVRQGLVLHDRQHRGHSDSVVGAQSGSGCLQILAVLHGLDRVRVEVVLDVGVLLLDHVQVGLEDGRW